MLYPITYKVTHHDPPLTRKQVGELSAKEGSIGATQRLLVFSIIEHDDGTCSMMHGSSSPVPGVQLRPDEMFKAWIMFASDLAREEELSPWMREVAEAARKAVAKHIHDQRAEAVST